MPDYGIKTTAQFGICECGHTASNHEKQSGLCVFAYTFGQGSCECGGFDDIKHNAANDVRIK